MSIINKIKLVASILLVFFIVLVTNIIDKENYNRLNYSVSTIYEDRIVASDLIFELSNIIKEQEIAVLTEDTLYASSSYQNSAEQIEGIVTRYEQTKLTDREELVFDHLKTELNKLDNLIRKNGVGKAESKPVLLKSIGKINHHLRDLSKIQLKEGKRQVSISNKAIDTINLFTQGEIIFLIIMAVLIQIVIFYKPREK